MYKEKVFCEEVLKKTKIYAKIIATIFGLLIPTYPVINYVYMLNYQIKCENFYGIPGIYFSKSANESFIYILLSILFLMLYFSPLFLEGYLNKTGGSIKYQEFYFIFLSLALGCFLGVINSMYIINLTYMFNSKYGIGSGTIEYINKNSNFILPVIIMGAISLLWSTLAPNIAKKGVKRFVILISLFSLLMSITIFTGGTFIELTKSIENKTKYEIITNKERDYIVISEKDGKILVSEYSFTDGKYKIFTNQYFFFDRKECRFNYLDMGEKPVIEK